MKPLTEAQKAEAAKARQALYHRNTQILREEKEARGCEECDHPFPHYVLDTLPGVSRLVGSRCSVEQLQNALKNVRVLCANCRKTIQWKSRKT